MKALVVGSGAGGAMAALHLSRGGAEVHLLEAGGPFKPLSRMVRHAGPLRDMGALGAEGNISRILPHMRTFRTGELVGVRGVGEGGCTVLSCGNMVRTERGLEEIGLDLGTEFDEVASSLSICSFPRERWRPVTRDMFDAAESLGHSPLPTPKAVDPGRCRDCGMCELGCRSGARWDSREWVRKAEGLGAVMHHGHEVQRVLLDSGRAVGVQVRTSEGTHVHRGDLVVLAAGGVGTAQVLLRSGLEVQDGLWMDPVVTLGGTRARADQFREAPMGWYFQGRSCMISPYLDLLSHFFHRPWRQVSIRDRVGVMVKLADSSRGRVNPDGSVQKSFDDEDRDNLEEAMQTVRSIMSEAGVGGPYVQGMINGGHLGGTRPLSAGDVKGMRPADLPDGLWLADLSLVPRSQGMPTMMLAAALGLRVAKTILTEDDGRVGRA